MFNNRNLTQHEDEEEGDSDTVDSMENQAKIEQRYLPFVSKMLDCLQRLEYTISDLGFEYFVDHEDTIKLFEHELISKDLPTRTLAERLEQKQDMREDIML